MDDLTQLGPYKIESLLGEGGMASVYRVWHTDLHRREALKLLPPHMAHDRSFVERFLGEARTAARLHHRSIATIHTVSSAEAPQPYFTMELIEGGDLADFISSRGRLRVGEASALLFQMAGALDYAHQQGVIHRDVKPANVLLDKSGTDIVPKLVDFGIARAQEEAGGSRLTRTGMIVGTPEYMSPEQAGSGSVVDGRTDQYALAILAYEMLCGSPPFRAEEGSTAISVIMRHLQETPRSISSLTSDVPESVSRAVLKALSKKPEDRYSSCTEFVQAIIHAAEDTRAVVPQAAAVSIPKVAAPQQGMPPQSRAASKVAAAATVMLALAGLAMIVMAVNRSHGAPKQSDTPTAVDGVSAEKPGQGNGEKSVHGSNVNGGKQPEPSASNTPSNLKQDPAEPSEGDGHEPTPSVVSQPSQPVVHPTAHYEAPWLTYRNAAAGYTIDYPYGWTYREKSYPKRSRTTFTSPEPGVSFFVDTGEASGSDVYSNMHAQDLSMRKRNNSTYQFVSLERTTTGADSPALWSFIRTSKQDGASLHVDYGIVKNHFGYAVLTIVPNERSREWDERFQHIRNSLNVFYTPSTATAP